MILVCTGTQGFPFDRLLRAADEFARTHPEEEVVAQTGCGTCEMRYCRHARFFSGEEMEELFSRASLLITHGGSGTVMKALSRGIPVVAVPRRKRYGEHVDDHQTQLVRALAKERFLVPCGRTEKLAEAVALARSGICRPYPSGPSRLPDDLAGYVGAVCRVPEGGKICLAASSGGHLAELRLAAAALREKYDCFTVTESTPFSPEDPDGYLLAGVNRRQGSMPFRMIGNTVRSLRILLREKPAVLVTTGALSVIPISVMGKCSGSVLVFVETYAVVRKPSRTGKLISRIADRFYVQWPDLTAVYPRAVYRGNVYADT